MDFFTTSEIDYYMNKLIEVCEKAIKRNEIPVSCIFIHIPSKKILIDSHNYTNLTHNASSHCEINCIKYLEKNIELYKKIDDKKIYNNLKELMRDCALFVSVEPCIMCAYALSLIEIKKVYFGCYNEKFGGNGSILSIHLGPGKSYESIGGFKKDNFIELLRKFYSVGNLKAPENKRQRKNV